MRRLLDSPEPLHRRRVGAADHGDGAVATTAAAAAHSIVSWLSGPSEKNV